MYLRLCVDEIHQYGHQPNPSDDSVAVEVSQQTPGMDLREQITPHCKCDWLEWWKGPTEVFDFTVQEFRGMVGDFTEGTVFVCLLSDEEMDSIQSLDDVKQVLLNHSTYLNWTRPAKQASKLLYAACLKDQDAKDKLSQGPQ